MRFRIVEWSFILNTGKADVLISYAAMLEMQTVPAI